MLTYNKKHKLFIWRGDYSSRGLPRNAGFDWHEAGKAWIAKSPYVAYQLIDHADSAAKAQFQPINRNIDRSNSLGNSEPGSIAGELFPYQQVGVKYLSEQLDFGRKGVLLAEEQGLGKSAQSLRIADALGYSKLLVICPASIRLNWEREVEMWHQGNKGVKAILAGKDLIPTDSSVIISYNFAEKVQHLEFDMVIVDEIHFIKNRETKRTIEVLKIVKKFPVVGLTGTPLPNGRPNELWPFLNACAPDIIGGLKYWPFVRRFCKIESDAYGDKIVGAKRTKELFTRLRGSGFMMRRLKKDVLKDLPPKRYQMIVFPVTGKTREIIKKEQAFDANEITKHGAPVGAGLPDIRREMGLAMVPQSVEYISDLMEGGVKKLLVFAYHVDVNQNLIEGLKKYNPVCITGSTLTKKRQEYVDRFQTDPHCRIFIGNLQAAGTGFTLTAAHDVIFVESSWVPGENDQASDRVHRIGQNERVLIHQLVVKGSLGARILGSAAMKRSDIEGVLGV